MELSLIEKNLESLKTIYHTESGKRKHLQTEVNTMGSELETLDSQVNRIEQEKMILSKICKVARKESSEFFKHLATSALQSVFGENTELVINLDQENNDVVAKLDFLIKSIYDDYTIENDPAEADGGGAADMVSLVSLFTLNYLKRAENKASLLLDEPTKYLSAGKSEKSAIFIKEMSEYLGRQIIMTTHHQSARGIADRGYEFKVNEQGYSEVVAIIDNAKEDD